MTYTQQLTIITKQLEKMKEATKKQYLSGDFDKQASKQFHSATMIIEETINSYQPKQFLDKNEKLMKQIALAMKDYVKVITSFKQELEAMKKSAKLKRAK